MLKEFASNGPEFPEGSPTDEELQSVRDMIVFIVMAIKNYAMYPDDHPVCQKSVASVRTCLDGFLSNHNNIRLDVEKDRLLFRGEVVYQGGPGSGNLAFIIFRDGIHWLEFQKGLDPWEINGFLKILNKYKNPQEEAEGDLVTALWESEFPHLKYNAVDVYWEAVPLIDVSVLSAWDGEQQCIDQEEEKQDIQVTMAGPTEDYSMWELTAQEIAELRATILDEEKRDRKEDALEVLLIVLNRECRQEEFAAILNFFEGEFQDALARGDFDFAFKVLSGLHEVRRSCKTEKPWARSLFNKFDVGISGPQVLGVLDPLWPTPDVMDPDRMKQLRQVLLLLPSQAIGALGPMLVRIDSSKIQYQLMEVIKVLADRDLRPLERLLDRPDESLVQRVVYILGRVKGEKPTQVLHKMICHPSERIRKQVLKALVVRKPQDFKEFFTFINDTSDDIRRLLLEHLGRQRSELGENLLMDYLQQEHFQHKDNQHVLACYSALGRCGSSRCVLFLQKMLLNRGWMPGFDRSTHRQGAVIALIALGTDDAKEILQKASRSLFPSIRLAYRKVVAGEKQKAEASH